MNAFPLLTRRAVSLLTRAASLRIHRAHRINAAVAMLLALLQRTPAPRIVAVTTELVASSPVGSIVRSAVLATASLGAMHTLAGATTLSATMTSPVNATVGSSLQIGFTVTNTINIGSWKISGTLPPGTKLTAMEGGNTLTGPGTLDATTTGVSDGYGGTTGGNSTTTPVLSGTPTTAGNYTFSLQAYELGHLSGLASNTFDFTINVTGGSVSTDTAPAITTQPQSQTVNAGASATFSVTATGSPAPSYQWRKDGTAINGATSASFSLTNVQSANAGNYTVFIANTAGNVTSTGATLTVNAVSTAPTFTLQPTSLTIAASNTAVFNAAATGATSYKWQRNGADVSGATSELLVINGATSANAGTYTCIATGSGGSTTSNAAGLTVTNASAVDTGHLINLSVRTNSGTGDQVLGTGFVIGGANTSGTKPLLIRVTGPALEQYGVPGWMVDPTLRLQPLNSSTIIGQNDNWGGDATIVSTSNAVGAFPLTNPASKDAALAVSLNGGGYTTLAIGANNTTGAVLTEVYDATSVLNFTATTPRLINVSARAQVNTGDDVLFAGFVLGGSTAKTVLIRATGPALANYGVGGTLADPKLELYQLNGPKLYENDNWGGSATLVTAANSVGAFPINDLNSKDAVLLVTLPPGGYSAKVFGANNGTGVALIEVYEVQ